MKVSKEAFFAQFGKPVPAHGFYNNYTSDEDQQILLAMIQTIRAKTVLEIGVQEGFTAKFLLRECDFITKYIGLDVAEGYTGWNYQAKEIPKVAGAKAADDPRFYAYVSPNGTKDLEADLSPLAGMQFDFIFVDAEHSYPGVKRDTDIARKLIAPKGIIVWHDYNWPWPGVIQYLDELMAQNQNVKHIDGTWTCYELN